MKPISRQARFQQLVQGEFKSEFQRALAIAVRRAVRQDRAQRTSPDLAHTIHGALARAQAQTWRAQAQQAQQQYPTLSLEQELQNPLFLRLLTDSQKPMTVQQAYEIIHLDEIRQQIAQEAAIRTAAHLQACARRPREGGAAPQAGLPTHWGASNPKARAAIARRAMRGEHIVL